jgi:predicted RNA-binding protein with EMAP domain
MSIKKFNNFKIKKVLKENKENSNYMFFDNLKHISRMASEIMKMSESEIDEMLTDGHDWANDHISKSMESIKHVYNFLITSLDRDMMSDKDGR